MQKRANVLANELQIQRKFNPRLISSTIETRLNRVHQVKQQLLATSGLNAQIAPLNDGTFEEDVLLTDTQSTSLLNSLRSRRKRSGVYSEGFPTQMWPKRIRIPYAFDVSLCKFYANLLLYFEINFSTSPSNNHQKRFERNRNKNLHQISIFFSATFPKSYLLYTNCQQYFVRNFYLKKSKF